MKVLIFLSTYMIPFVIFYAVGYGLLSKKLLEDLPNKITDTMGIIADVNLRQEGTLEYIEVVVENILS